MDWKQTFVIFVMDFLRLLFWAGLLLNGVTLATMIVYVFAKLCWFFTDYLDHKIFLHPWW